MNGRVYLPPPSACESLDSVLARCGGTRDARGAREFTVLPGGRVYGAGIVLSPDGGAIISEFAHDFGSAGTGRHWLQDYGQIRPPVRIAGRTAVVAVNLGAGYAHWLLEELPRWLALREIAVDNVIAHTGARFIQEVLALAALPARVISVSRHAHFECATLVIPALIAPDAGMIAALNAFARAQSLPASEFGEKLYISREHAGRRRVRNEPALWAQLAARGFSKLHLETLSWREQVSAFSAAKCVVAPHGAGLANLVFCRPGTRIVEFFHPHYVNRGYERLSRTAELDYRTACPADAGCDPKAGRLDIEADIPALLETLGE